MTKLFSILPFNSSKIKSILSSRKRKADCQHMATSLTETQHHPERHIKSSIHPNHFTPSENEYKKQKKIAPANNSNDTENVASSQNRELNEVFPWDSEQVLSSETIDLNETPPLHKGYVLSSVNHAAPWNVIPIQNSNHYSHVPHLQHYQKNLNQGHVAIDTNIILSSLACILLPLPSALSWSASVKRTRNVIESFTVAPYVPPWYGKNRHLQTFLPFFFRIPFEPLQYQRIRKYTPTGDDFFDVDVLRGYLGHFAPSVIIVCGTEGHSRGPHTLRIVRIFHEAGWHVFVVNWRGCSGEPNHLPKTYHFGFTEDLDIVVRDVAGEIPSNGSLYLVGLSLGGNVVTKYLIENNHLVDRYKIRGAAVSSIPFESKATTPRFQQGLGKHFYQRNFLRKLKKKTKIAHKKNPGSFDLKRVLAAETIRDFEEHYICKVFGFSDLDEYDQAVNVKPGLKKINVPLYVLNAEDDPLISETAFATSEDVGLAPIYLDYRKVGGHLGFINREYFKKGTSFIGASLFRFLTHVQSHFTDYTNHVGCFKCLQSENALTAHQPTNSNSFST